ncbi:conserved hypothetical protein [Ricinus communis]|uniref:Uncharacterized protein n=1 Tax=Ricinus communis TaxID=3988 RepID=B9S862_RICCO|nr:conserved hypothetical protein [Ricinus communis]
MDNQCLISMLLRKSTPPLYYRSLWRSSGCMSYKRKLTFAIFIARPIRVPIGRLT